MGRVYSPDGAGGISFTLAVMQSSILNRLGLANPWAQEASVAGILLAVGFGLLPLFIYLAGSLLLGRYDGASPAALYHEIYHGLTDGETAAWIVVLGPYGLHLIFRGLQAWWRAGTGPR